MPKYFSLFFVFLLNITDSLAQNLVKEQYADGATKAQGKYTPEHLRDSTWLFFYPNGQQSAQISYKNGALHGQAKHFDFNGKLQAIEQWHNDLQEDTSWYYEEGVLQKYGKMQRGVYEGFWRFFNKNGLLVRHGTYENGLPSGFWEFWDDNGKLWQQGFYVAGKEDGHWKFYSEKGIIEREGDYAEGKPIGQWKYYNKKGKFVKEAAPPEK
jgi:antitoxin component YwqK of YwqJK toxin-antitoxin module